MADNNIIKLSILIRDCIKLLQNTYILKLVPELEYRIDRFKSLSLKLCAEAIKQSSIVVPPRFIIFLEESIKLLNDMINHNLSKQGIRVGLPMLTAKSTIDTNISNLPPVAPGRALITNTMLITSDVVSPAPVAIISLNKSTLDSNQNITTTTISLATPNITQNIQPLHSNHNITNNTITLPMVNMTQTTSTLKSTKKTSQPSRPGITTQSSSTPTRILKPNGGYEDFGSMGLAALRMKELCADLERTDVKTIQKKICRCFKQVGEKDKMYQYYGFQFKRI